MFLLQGNSKKYYLYGYLNIFQTYVFRICFMSVFYEKKYSIFFLYLEYYQIFMPGFYLNVQYVYLLNKTLAIVLANEPKQT